MSFAIEVINELLENRSEKSCCRKAFVAGLCIGAVAVPNEKNKIRMQLRTKEVAELAAELLEKQFSAVPELCRAVKAGREVFVLDFFSKSLSTYLRSIDRVDPDRTLGETAGFRCKDCAVDFLRGAFAVCGTVNDPQRGYHAEFILPTPMRAGLLSELLASVFNEPKTVTRGGRTGVYYKNNETVADLLNYLGAGMCSLAVTNSYIERDIRNTENRATNCVARNISKSVDASMRQIEAIKSLISSGKILSLPEELRYTADLRLENPAASLFELSHMHEPPISKSGLNRRLTRLIEESEDI
jgi:DNA-binding protein WhiA